jgi:hypothetical protein
MGRTTVRFSCIEVVCNYEVTVWGERCVFLFGSYVEVGNRNGCLKL